MSKTHNTKWYRHWRKRVLTRANNTCDITGAKTNIQAHHSFDASTYPKFKKHIKKGIAIEKQIHKLFHIYWMGGFNKSCTLRDYIEFKDAYLNDTLF